MVLSVVCLMLTLVAFVPAPLWLVLASVSLVLALVSIVLILLSPVMALVYTSASRVTAVWVRIDIRISCTNELQHADHCDLGRMSSTSSQKM